MFTKQLKFAHHLGSLGTNIATEFSNGSVGPPAADSLTSMPSVMYLQLFGFYVCSAGRFRTVVCTVHDQIQWQARTQRKMDRWKGILKWTAAWNLPSGHLILVSDDVRLENRTWKPTKPARITSAMNLASTKRQKVYLTVLSLLDLKW